MNLNEKIKEITKIALDVFGNLDFQYSNDSSLYIIFLNHHMNMMFVHIKSIHIETQAASIAVKS